MGAQLSHALSDQGTRHQVTTLGIGGGFGQSAYMAEHLYEAYGLATKGYGRCSSKTP